MPNTNTELVVYQNLWKYVKERYIADSFQAQWRDLRFLDLSDGLGVLKFYSLLPDDMVIKTPHIYKLSQDEQSFLIIGTCHVVPLNVYPPQLTELLLNQRTLIIECTGGDDESDEEPCQIEEPQISQVNFLKLIWRHYNLSSGLNNFL